MLLGLRPPICKYINFGSKESFNSTIYNTGILNLSFFAGDHRNCFKIFSRHHIKKAFLGPIWNYELFKLIWWPFSENWRQGRDLSLRTTVILHCLEIRTWREKRWSGQWWRLHRLCNARGPPWSGCTGTRCNLPDGSKKKLRQKILTCKYNLFASI